MKTRNKNKFIVIGFRCYGCDEPLTDSDEQHYDIFEGFCEECYTTSMAAAYEDEQAINNPHPHDEKLLK